MLEFRDYSTLAMCNNVLEKSFRDRCLITPRTLQDLLYVVASELSKAGVAIPLTSDFFVAKNGPTVTYIAHKFKPFEGGRVKKYARNAAGEALCVVDDTLLNSCATRAWSIVERGLEHELHEALVSPVSSWMAAHRSGDMYIPVADIVSDCSYRKLLRADYRPQR